MLPVFRGFMKRLGRLVRHRNMIAHHIPHVHPSGKFIFFNDKENKDGSFSFSDVEQFDFTNIKNWAGDIVRLQQDMMKKLSDMSSVIHTSPKTHRERQDDHSQNSDPSRQEPTREEQQSRPGSSDG
jgi:hypothetical protein